MRTIHRNQAEIEAREFSQREHCVTTVYKLIDGRYEVARGYNPDRGGEAVSQYRAGVMVF